MPIVTYPIVTGNDDVGETNAGSLFYSGTTVKLNRLVHGGARFQAVTVPPGSTINSATLRITGTPFCLQAGNCTSGIMARLIADCPPWSAPSALPSQAPHTVAVTTLFYDNNFSINGPYKTFLLDVQAQIIEIIALAGWASGNAIGFFLASVTYGRLTHINWNTYEHSYPESKLIIDFTVPVPVVAPGGRARSRCCGINRKIFRGNKH